MLVLELSQQGRHMLDSGGEVDMEQPGTGRGGMGSVSEG